MKNILIIDDSIETCFILSTYLKKEKFETAEAYTGQAALKLLNKNKYDIIFCDYRLPDFDGIDLLREIRKKDDKAGVIMMTAYADVKIALQCIKLGALDYLTKPIHHQEVLSLVNSFLQRGEPKENIPGSSPRVKNVQTFVWGKSDSTQRLQKNIELIAPTDMSVIIYGESGTGKEVVARSIHDKSKRKDKPFVAIDCGALSEELAASEMFGHIKGSFTGAVQDKIGQFEYAKGGTLFLDEIGNLTYDNQVKLLRVLQEHKIRRVGANNDIAIDVRVIVASNENLTDLAKTGKFREDLYHRLNEFMIRIEPLRNRINDIEVYMQHFLQEANTALGKNVTAIDDLTTGKLINYHWHGNLRELRNVIKRAVLVASTDVLTIECIPEEIILGDVVKEQVSMSDRSLADFNLQKVVAETEKQAILYVLSKSKNNRSRAAKTLAIDRKTLYNKMRVLGIE